MFKSLQSKTQTLVSSLILNECVSALKNKAEYIFFHQPEIVCIFFKEYCAKNETFFYRTYLLKGDT